MYKNPSLRKKNKAVKKERSLKGVRAKARMLMASEPPDYPNILDRSGDYRIIHIEDSLQGEHVLLLTPCKKENGYCNQWHVWLDSEYQGIMGWKRAYTLIGQQYARARAI